jgi:hypothetical protein
LPGTTAHKSQFEANVPVQIEANTPLTSEASFWRLGSTLHNASAFEPTALRRRYSAMETPTDFRKFAEECDRLPEQAETDHQRNILKRMAEAWKQVADEEDQKGFQ